MAEKPRRPICMLHHYFQNHQKLHKNLNLTCALFFVRFSEWTKKYLKIIKFIYIYIVNEFDMGQMWAKNKTVRAGNCPPQCFLKLGIAANQVIFYFDSPLESLIYSLSLSLSNSILYRPAARFWSCFLYAVQKLIRPRPDLYLPNLSNLLERFLLFSFEPSSSCLSAATRKCSHCQLHSNAECTFERESQ